MCLSYWAGTKISMIINCFRLSPSFILFLCVFKFFLFHHSFLSCQLKIFAVISVADVVKSFIETSSFTRKEALY